MEFWDVYNADGMTTGRKQKKGTSFQGNDYHMAIEAWILDSQNRLLIQQRSFSCEILPGAWAMTTGRIVSGENTVTGCIRELQEELGLTITEKNLTKLARFHKEENHIIWDIFLVQTDFSIHDLSYQPEEVADARLVTIDELRALVADKQVFVYAEICQIIDMIEEIINSSK